MSLSFSSRIALAVLAIVVAGSGSAAPPTRSAPVPGFGHGKATLCVSPARQRVRAVMNATAAPPAHAYDRPSAGNRHCE